MSFRSGEEEFRLKLVDLLLTMLKDASIKGIEFGIPPEQSMQVLEDMVEQLSMALKYHKDLLAGRGNFDGGFPSRRDDDSTLPPMPPRRSPYNRS